MNNSIRMLFIALAVGLIIFSVIFGGKVTFNEQMPIYDGLRNTSAIIFAVMGAWIALLYPGKLRSEEHTSELQSRGHLVCRLLLEKKKKQTSDSTVHKRMH